MTRRQQQTAHQRKCIKDVGFTTTKYDNYDYRGIHNGHEITIESGVIPGNWKFIVDGIEGQETHDTKVDAIWWALAEIKAF